MFAYATVDRGEVAPSFQAYPSDLVGTQVTVRLPLDLSRLPAGASASDVVVRRDGQPVVRRVEAGDVVVETGACSSLQVGLAVPYVEDAEGQRAVVPDDANRLGAQYASACANTIASNRTYYEDYLLNTSRAVYTSTCVDSDPPLHIIIGAVFGSKAKGGVGYAVRHQTSPAGSGVYNLRRLDEHVADFDARSTTMTGAVNGFTWDPTNSSSADQGFEPGGKGRLRGRSTGTAPA